jgi:hypothetical protein
MTYWKAWGSDFFENQSLKLLMYVGAALAAMLTVKFSTLFAVKAAPTGGMWLDFGFIDWSKCNCNSGSVTFFARVRSVESLENLRF